MKFQISNLKSQNKGFSLIETLVGMALILVVFVGIFGVFQLAIKIVNKSKAKVGALALANERIEFIRNLPYNSVGTLGGIPPGNIPQTENISLNDINYTRRTIIQYIDDPKDGLDAIDENGITTDYKVAKVEVTWQANYVITPVFLTTNIVSKGIETTVGGGTLKLNVFDAAIIPVASANVHIENSTVSPPVSIDILTNASGKVVFPGTPSASNYKITVSKVGYSSTQTYDATAPNVNPDPGHLTILEGQTTEASFAIDLVSAKTIKTWEPIGGFSWQDLFNDDSKISESFDVVVASGYVELDQSEPSVYKTSGYVVSMDIGGIADLKNWSEFSWNDNEPAGANIKYFIYYINEFSNLVPIPDSDLPGNESGFETSPIDLSGLDINKYQTLRLKAELSTSDTSVSPQLLNWNLSWNAGPFPLPNIGFHMQGQKIIGRDVANNPIYKYSENLSTGAGGSVLLGNLEWDIYNITIDGVSTGYDIAESCPFQPVNIAPNTNNTTDLYLVGHANNTLLVFVKNSLGEAIGQASVRSYRTLYDKTQTTSLCGQTFFTPLSAVDYTIEASKAGYATGTSTVSVSGQSKLEIILNAI
ncbi:prepilin-type N-terminal cleavage/methylation domain-containing protein [Patescibacteria group bacterium]|nr:prepilin-type N-terminal cleavage/methylation domain-containing protein [Patescibacteria group bacterium]MBU4353520.1 prepilin-type N-terminal cleavage/methylation domain-containing protein [Patescibacteria group bacterium]MBU4477434.1 prepilin-type N-terminal cleavage/methylation domain-containing protein [Patescibacteria group bacterium]MCG2699403.1 prepilin-type N-terminal cleavage/methylation domain-containing protein [Candidatus Parcubacteria bacterium]